MKLWFITVGGKMIIVRKLAGFLILAACFIGYVLDLLKNVPRQDSDYYKIGQLCLGPIVVGESLEKSDGFR